MSKFNKLIKAFRILAKRPYLINNILNDKNELKIQVVKENKELQNGFPVLNLLDILPNFNTTISPFSFLNGGSLPTDLGLLKGLAQQKENCTYFEIGTWRGESVANVSPEAKECYTLNLSNNELKELGYNDEYLNQQGFYSKEIKNITHLKGNSFDFDFSPYYNKCDIVFVDGDHHYKSVVNDTKIAFKLLKNEHSIIVWHDYTRNPGEIRWDILKGIWDGTPTNKRKNLFSVSNTLCALFTNNPTTPSKDNKITPNKVFNVNLTAKRL